jgi:PRC-barrel domain protein
MLKTLMTTVAATALLAGAAVAQTPANPPVSSPPAATMSNAGRQVVTEQKADQILATKFKGTDVIGADNAKIGDVSDILLDNNGKVDAYVIQVGGFLGIGSKYVALSPTSFQVQPATDKENMKLKLSMSKDDLKQMAEFKQRSEPGQSTTGQAPGTRDRAPATAPAAK